MYAETILRHCERRNVKPGDGQVAVITSQIKRIRECYAPSERAKADADNLEQRLAKLLSMSK